MIFKNRAEAGKLLAEKLKNYEKNPNTVVLGLPRGGVVVAHEIARVLNIPLDVLIVRKIGAPGNPELAIGATDEKGTRVLEETIIQLYNISPDYIEEQTREKMGEAKRRSKLYRKNRAPIDLKNKTVILIDDGIATGSTMLAAIKSAKASNAGKIITAAPVIALDSLEKLKTHADEIFYIDAPVYFNAVGAFYEDFKQVEDDEVIKLLS